MNALYVCTNVGKDIIFGVCIYVVLFMNAHRQELLTHRVRSVFCLVPFVQSSALCVRALNRDVDRERGAKMNENQPPKK